MGRAKDLTRDSFLVHADTFDHFVLRFSFRVLAGNSGVQVRSVECADDAPRPMRGPQVELVAGKWGSVFIYGGGDKNETGGLPENLASSVVDAGWNEASIQALGDEITVTVNGITTAKLAIPQEVAPTAGNIALQLHRGEPNEIRLRDIRIRPVKVAPN